MNYSNDKIAIVIQGPSKYVNEIKNIWKDYKNDLIFSTWEGYENLYDENDIVIFNKEPEFTGPYNFNFQKISTYNGLLKAKDLGYNFALKIRSDYFPINPNKFLNLMDFNKINVLMWSYTTFLWKDYPNLKGYFTDHFMFGPINDLINLWDIDTNFCSSTEVILTWNYIKKLRNKIDLNFLLNKLNDDNDLFFAKENSKSNNILGHNDIINISNRNIYGRFESVFKNINDFNKPIENIYKYLNNNYLDFLKYFIYLPEITIINDNGCEITYPKIKYADSIDNVDTDYFIYSNDIKNKYDLILNYFNIKDIYYVNPISYEINAGSSTVQKKLEKSVKKL